MCYSLWSTGAVLQLPRLRLQHLEFETEISICFGIFMLKSSICINKSEIEGSGQSHVFLKQSRGLNIHPHKNPCLIFIMVDYLKWCSLLSKAFFFLMSTCNLLRDLNLTSRISLLMKKGFHYNTDDTVWIWNMRNLLRNNYTWLLYR